MRWRGVTMPACPSTAFNWLIERFCVAISIASGGPSSLYWFAGAPISDRHGGCMTREEDML